MSKTFKYSILQYKHHPNSDEILNLGILFIFPDEKYIHFATPKKIARLKHAYFDLNEKDIKAYLHSFDNYAVKFSRRSENLIKYKYNYNDLISEKFLIKDATSLQFTPIREGLKVLQDIKETIDYYFKIHLYYYQSEVDTRRVVKHTEQSILKQFKTILYTKNDKVRQAIKNEDLELRSADDEVYFKANFKWEDKSKHSNNFVRAVSFDLQERDAIADKALLYQAKLNYLAPLTNQQSIRFDLIIGAPTDQSLRSDFQKAKKLLQATTAKHQLVVAEHLDDYIEQIIAQAELGIN